MTKVCSHTEVIWCDYCQALHPVTGDYFYFRVDGSVLGCKERRKAMSRRWNAANKVQKAANDRRKDRRRRRRNYQAMLEGK